MEKKGMDLPPGIAKEYVCATCGTAFPTESERKDHNNSVHR
jgi:hypothetical protein